MANINFENLLSTGAHFGHVKRKWHPAFEPYILMEKNGIHIINLDETMNNLENALSFIRKVVQKKGEFLFVGTKKQARDIIQQEADRCSMFYVVERWLGGTLTNYSTIKKSIKRLHMLEKEGSSIYDNLTKKEVQMLNRERIKLADQHRGIKDMKKLPDVVIVVDANHEITAVRESTLLEIPVIAIVDTNTDPNIVDYPIPANDDSIRTIQLIISAIADAICMTIEKDEDDVAGKTSAGNKTDENEIVETELTVNADKNTKADSKISGKGQKADETESENLQVESGDLKDEKNQSEIELDVTKEEVIAL